MEASCVVRAAPEGIGAGDTKGRGGIASAGLGERPRAGGTDLSEVRSQLTGRKRVGARGTGIVAEVEGPGNRVGAAGLREGAGA